MNFCANCGDRLSAASVEVLAVQVIALREEIAKLTKNQAAKEQHVLEIETAEAVVSRVMNWAKIFGFFVGLPLVVMLLVASVLIGKQMKSIYDVVDQGKQNVAKLLDKAKAEAKSANDQAEKAIYTSYSVDLAITDTQRRLDELNGTLRSRSAEVSQLDASVKQQQARLATLSTDTLAQAKVVSSLSQKVQEVRGSQIERQIENLHPEYGDHFVIASNGEMPSKETKGRSKTYVFIDLFKDNLPVASISSKQFASAVEALESHNIHPFIGQLALAAGARNPGMSMAMLGAFNSNVCLTLQIATSNSRQGAPCIVYFQENVRSKAIEVRQILAPTERIPDDRVKLVPVSSLPPILKEIVERSDLDMAIVLGP